MRQEIAARFQEAGTAFKRIKGDLERWDEEMDGGFDEDSNAQYLWEVVRVLAKLCGRTRMGRDGKAFGMAEAVHTAFVNGDVERASFDGKVVPPSRGGMLTGLAYAIAERNTQLKGLAKEFERSCPGQPIDTAPNGIAVAYRNVVRERDVLVAARDSL